MAFYQLIYQCMKPKYDMLWKGVIEEIMEDLLLFIDPEIGKKLDLERGFEYLDKELAELYPEPERPANSRVVDKLVKVFLLDGSERWMLLHLEIQGNNDKDFAARMFEYYIRVHSKHQRPVAAIAVLTGKNAGKMPAVFEDTCLWMRARYEFKTICIDDYPDEALRSSTNPFAAVMVVAKEALARVKGSDDERDRILLEHKLSIVRLLKERLAVFGKKKSDAILVFLNNYLVFKKSGTNRKFMVKSDQILGKTHTMGLVELLVESKHQEGVQEGLEKAVERLLTNSDFSSKKIAELIGVPIAVVTKVKRRVNKKRSQ